MTAAYVEFSPFGLDLQFEFKRETSSSTEFVASLSSKGEYFVSVTADDGQAESGDKTFAIDFAYNHAIVKSWLLTNSFKLEYKQLWFKTANVECTNDN